MTTTLIVGRSPTVPTNCTCPLVPVPLSARAQGFSGGDQTRRMIGQVEPVRLQLIVLKERVGWRGMEGQKGRIIFPLLKSFRTWLIPEGQ